VVAGGGRAVKVCDTMALLGVGVSTRVATTRTEGFTVLALVEYVDCLD
jgi:hypothetical protein